MALRDVVRDLERRLDEAQEHADAALADATRNAHSDHKDNQARIDTLEASLARAEAALSSSLDELRRNSSVRIAAAQGAASTAAVDTASLKTQLALVEASVEACQSAQAETASQAREACQGVQAEGRDIAVLKAQVELLQADGARASQREVELARQLQEVRAELSALQQRHAAFESRSVVEQSSAAASANDMRSAVDAHTVRHESVEASLLKAQAERADAAGSIERLKKVARQQQALIKEAGVAADSKAVELRSLVRAVAEHLQPMQSLSRRHSEQIDELTSAVNQLIEMIKSTWRSGEHGATSGLAWPPPSSYGDVLHAFRKGRI